MKVLLVGVGPVGIEYTKVLKDQGHEVMAVGRSAAGCENFTKATSVATLGGGIEGAAADAVLPEAAIVAVSEAQLGNAARELMRRGVRRILLEKPGGANTEDIHSVAAVARETGSDVRVGYNRRFHASTLAAQKLIAEDGGVRTFTFEFTEWSHRIGPLVKEPGVKEQWLLHNSTHVIDLAFHLGGWPSSFYAFSAGGLPWHARSRYAGAGVTQGGALFSYFADWEAPGRWVVEMLTSRRRLVFRPLEKLQVQQINSVAVEPVEIDDSLDVKFKPGYWRQVKAFLETPGALLPLSTQVAHLDVFGKIASPS